MLRPTRKYTAVKSNESGSELQHKTQRFLRTASTRLSTRQSSMKGVRPLAITTGVLLPNATVGTGSQQEAWPRNHRWSRYGPKFAGWLGCCRFSLRYRQEPRAYPRHPGRASYLVVPATCRTIANASRAQLIEASSPKHSVPAYGKRIQPMNVREYKGEVPRKPLPRTL
jgi:hypothetical protein